MIGVNLETLLLLYVLVTAAQHVFSKFHRYVWVVAWGAVFFLATMLVLIGLLKLVLP